MTLDEILKHFGSPTKTARALGLKPQAIRQWAKRVPSLRQIQIQELTEGKLKADPDIYQTRGTAA